eukprot:TRINITY_DN50914_c0_g1_i1.p1 TRINITY_DN50914_c0_g1~~TRINITY_DN50914_c0_g1_i1.p1  ORF type:complete len:353 (+),score=97.79 TRINITY_DN50914_c0_g1_i1:30-1061(+)
MATMDVQISNEEVSEPAIKAADAKQEPAEASKPESESTATTSGEEPSRTAPSHVSEIVDQIREWAESRKAAVSEAEAQKSESEDSSTSSEEEQGGGWSRWIGEEDLRATVQRLFEPSSPPPEDNQNGDSARVPVPPWWLWAGTAAVFACGAGTLVGLAFSANANADTLVDGHVQAMDMAASTKISGLDGKICQDVNGLIHTTETDAEVMHRLKMKLQSVDGFKDGCGDGGSKMHLINTTGDVDGQPDAILINPSMCPEMDFNINGDASGEPDALLLRPCPADMQLDGDGDIYVLEADGTIRKRSKASLSKTCVRLLAVAGLSFVAGFGLSSVKSFHSAVLLAF